MNICTKAAFLVVSSLVAGIATATEFVWTGAAGDGAWKTPENWSVDGETATTYPNAQDAVVRFTKSEDVAVTTKGCFSLCRLSVECVGHTVTVKFTTSGEGLKIGDNNTTTGVIDVVTGATALFDAELGGFNSNHCLMKTGGGLLSSTDRRFGINQSTPACLIIDAGSFENKFRFSCPKVVVRSGAVVTASGSENSGPYGDGTVVVVEKGAVYSRPTWVNGIVGEGTVAGNVSVNLRNGPYRFDGLVTNCEFTVGSANYADSTNIFIVGRPDTLKFATLGRSTRPDRLRYAPDAGGRFEIMKVDCRIWPENCPMIAEDANSNGVTVVFGSMNYMGDGATYSKNYLYAGKGTMLFGNGKFATANCLKNVTGFIGAKTGSSITLGGDEGYDLGLAGTYAQGTIVYSSSDLEQKGLLIGSGTVNVTANTTFDEFALRGGKLAVGNDKVLAIAGGLGWIDSLTWNNSNKHNITMRGGVLSGPFAVDESLAQVVATKLPRPQAITNYNNYAQYGGVHMYGGEIHLRQQTSANSPTRWTLDGGTVYAYTQLPKTPTVGFNGTRLALCPPDETAMAAFGSAIPLAEGGVTVLNGLNGGAAARTVYLVGASTADGVTTDGGVTRYGAGTFYFMRPATFCGPFRALDGVLLVPNNSFLSGKTDPLYGSGALELGNVKFMGDGPLERVVALNGTTVSGGAFVMPNKLAVSFASVAFQPGGALFVDAAKTVAYGTEPVAAPIFGVAGGVLTPSAYATANHLALNGGTLGDAAFTAHGIVAVGADAEVTGTLTGESGVGFVGPADGVKRVLTLSGETAVSGGVFVNAVEARPENSAALGAGAVTVGAGEWMGGRLRFTRPLTFANAVTAGGWGPVDEQGALVFDASAAIGSLTASRALRLRVNAGAVATVTGALTADEMVQIAGNGGTLALMGGKTGSGRLDVVNATLKVGGAKPSLGTGDIWLDDATLEFVNTSPIVVSNRLYGIGRIIARGADVSFVSPSVNFDGKVEIPGSAKVTFPTQAQLSENLQIIFNRTEDRGGRADLGGVYRKIDRVVGYGTVENATLEPSRTWEPRGLILMVR